MRKSKNFEYWNWSWKIPRRVPGILKNPEFWNRILKKDRSGSRRNPQDPTKDPSISDTSEKSGKKSKKILKNPEFWNRFRKKTLKILKIILKDPLESMAASPKDLSAGSQQQQQQSIRPEKKDQNDPETKGSMKGSSFLKRSWLIWRESSGSQRQITTPNKRTRHRCRASQDRSFSPIHCDGANRWPH